MQRASLATTQVPHRYVLSQVPEREIDPPRGIQTVPLVSLVSTGGTIYAASKNKLYALHAATGEQRWAFDARTNIIAAPVVTPGTILVGTSRGRVYALDTSSSEHQWTYETRGYGSQWFIAVADEMAFLGGDMQLVAVDIESGDEVWQVDVDSEIRASPAVVGDTVFLATYGQAVHALDAGTGEQQWQVSGGGGKSSPVVTDGFLFIGGRGSVVYAYD